MKNIINKFVLVLSLMLSFSEASAAPPDNVVLGFIQQHAYEVGNSDAPSLAPGNYPNGVERCHSSLQPSDANCPGDLLYTPNANTGGYQSFGVGITNFDAGLVAWPQCYIYWQSIGGDGDGATFPYVICIWYQLVLPDYSIGTAAAQIKFGAASMSSPWGSKPMSTMAFKAHHVYFPYTSSVVCTPTQSNSLDFDAKCLSSQQDVYAVEANGYEDKIIMTDKNCSAPVRPPFIGLLKTGTAEDAQNGCFVTNGTWGTNLPSPYPDTTYLDGTLLFQPAIGSAEPHLVTEGNFYNWYYEFYQYGKEQGSGQWEFWHNSAVTSFLLSSYLTCTTTTLNMCYFNVDQVRISPKAYFP